MTLTTRRKILLLGSGFVAPPCVEYLVRKPENKVTIGMFTEFMLLRVKLTTI